MNKEEFVEFTIGAFQHNGYGDLIDAERAAKLYALCVHLVDANRITNLTAITDQSEVVLKHFLDSATICRHIKEGATVLDVGCGAGFPSLPIAILRSDVLVTSIDSTGKKIEFVKSAIDTLGLKNASAVCGRAEELISNRREAFDVCTSRAVARLNVLIELCAPYVKVGGLFAAMKSNKWNEELSEVENSSRILGFGGHSVESISLELNEEKIERTIVCFEKVKSTSPDYPRKYAQIVKKPL